MHARLRSRTVRRGAFLVSAVATLASAQQPRREPHRAIIISFDGFSEMWLRKYSDSASAPALWGMFGKGVCAESVRPAFPSVTPTSHASIWTGAYPLVNGVSASQNAALPWPQKTIIESVDGYSPKALRAEPIWISAARQGVEVWSHMATQSPQPPAYIPVTEDTPALEAARASAAAALERSNAIVANTYNDLIADAMVITSPAKLAWQFGKTDDSLRATIRDDSTVVVRLVRDPRHSVSVRLAAVDTTIPKGRSLARFFSAPLEIDLKDGRRTFLYFRLWELSHDRTKLMLYVSEARAIQTNRPEIARAYDRAVQGVPGNGATKLWERGELGPMSFHGGDGTAEFRYFETAELVTRQFMRGFAWGWHTYHPTLSTDYLPYPDEILHHFLAMAEPSTPNVPASARANAMVMLKRMYMMVDRRLADLESIASQMPNTRLFVTGEHGMRSTWISLRPNIILEAAGLLAADSSGKIDLSHTQAAWAAGAWVKVNTAAHKGGIVSPDSVNAVLARVERALLAARDSTGQPVVKRVYRAGTVEGDSLGIGGAGGGDLYIEPAAGYYWSAIAKGPMAVPLSYPMGEHGFPSPDRDMHPLLCVLNAGAPRRIGEVRTIDLAPTISAWLGIAPPRDAMGRVLFR